MRAGLSCWIMVSAMMAAAGGSSSSRVTVLVEVEAGNEPPARMKCFASVDMSAAAAERDAAVRAAALEKAGVDSSTHACDVLWRREDVATATVSASRGDAKALPCRAWVVRRRSVRRLW